MGKEIVLQRNSRPFIQKEFPANAVHHKGAYFMIQGHGVTKREKF